MGRLRRTSALLVPLLVLLGLVVVAAPPASALPPENNPGLNPPDISVPPPFTPPANGFDWSVPARFGATLDSNGILDYHWDPTTATYDSSYVHPTSFTVSFQGCPNPTEFTGNDANPPTTQYTYDWEDVTSSGDVPLLPDPGTPAAGYPTKSCHFTHTFTDVDPVTAATTHTVQLTVTQPTQPAPTTTTTTQVVNPHDTLIVSLGDSYASGEGAPDIPQVPCFTIGCTTKLPVWEDERCHRSSNAGPAQAALAVAAADPHQSVTFLSFACSGATIATFGYGGASSIDPYYGPSGGGGTCAYTSTFQSGFCGDPNKPLGEGILGPYAGTEGGKPGAEPDYAHPLPSQIDQMTTAVGTRRIDALPVSGGGNDLGFGEIAQFCTVALNCDQQKVFNGLTANKGFVSLNQRVANDAASLAADYQALATDICVPDANAHCTRNVAKVYLTEYPDPTPRRQRRVLFLDSRRCHSRRTVRGARLIPIGVHAGDGRGRAAGEQRAHRPHLLDNQRDQRLDKPRRGYVGT